MSRSALWPERYARVFADQTRAWSWLSDYWLIVKQVFHLSDDFFSTLQASIGINFRGTIRFIVPGSLLNKILYQGWARSVSMGERRLKPIISIFWVINVLLILDLLLGYDVFVDPCRRVTSRDVLERLIQPRTERRRYSVDLPHWPPDVDVARPNSCLATMSSRASGAERAEILVLHGSRSQELV